MGYRILGGSKSNDLVEKSPPGAPWMALAHERPFYGKGTMCWLRNIEFEKAMMEFILERIVHTCQYCQGSVEKDIFCGDAESSWVV